MAPLTWRNVDAPNLSNAANMTARATAGITGAFKAGGDIGRGIYDDQVEIGSRDAMRAAQQFTTSADWTNALQNGTAYGNMDPRFINAETLAWGADRRRGLLGEEQIVQNMEIQRQQEARAAAAAAQRAAGGGLGVLGKKIITSLMNSVVQKETQSNSGGLTDIYLELGTYVKSFYSVIAAPSCVKVALMGDKQIRLHHAVTWKNAVPKIIREC